MHMPLTLMLFLPTHSKACTKAPREYALVGVSVLQCIFLIIWCCRATTRFISLDASPGQFIFFVFKNRKKTEIAWICRKFEINNNSANF